MYLLIIFFDYKTLVLKQKYQLLEIAVLKTPHYYFAPIYLSISVPRYYKVFFNFSLFFSIKFLENGRI